MDEKGLEARQRLKKVLEQKVGPPPATTSSESRLPIPNPNHVKPKPNDVIRLNDDKPYVVKPNDTKLNEVKQNSVKSNVAKPSDVASVVTSRPENASKSYPDSAASAVGQSMKVRSKFVFFMFNAHNSVELIFVGNKFS